MSAETVAEIVNESPVEFVLDFTIQQTRRAIGQLGPWLFSDDFGTRYRVPIANEEWRETLNEVDRPAAIPHAQCQKEVENSSQPAVDGTITPNIESAANLNSFASKSRIGDARGGHTAVNLDTIVGSSIFSSNDIASTSAATPPPLIQFVNGERRIAKLKKPARLPTGSLPQTPESSSAVLSSAVNQ
jgi:hypothetical protein